MRSHKHMALLVTLPLLLLGSTGTQTTRFFYQWHVWDATINNGLTTSPTSAQAFQGLSTIRRAIFPPTMNVRFVEWGITATEALTTANGEDCEYRLRTGAYGSLNGTEITSSQITVGEDTANTTCENGTAELNAIHEQCRVVLDPNDSAVTLSFGGWWDVISDDVPAASECAEVKGLEFWVVVDRQ